MNKMLIHEVEEELLFPLKILCGSKLSRFFVEDLHKRFYINFVSTLSNHIETIIFVVKSKVYGADVKKLANRHSGF